MHDEAPPTLEEMAARARGQQNPFACRRCGCQHWNVVNTYLAGRGGETRIQRQRSCRNCGQEGITTSEVVVPKGQRAIVVPKSEEAKSDEREPGAESRGQGAESRGQGPGVSDQYEEDDRGQPDPPPPAPTMPPAGGNGTQSSHRGRRRKKN